MTGPLENRIIILTGGGTGIGRATSLLLAQNGAHVVVSDFNAEEGQLTVSKIKEQSGSAEFIACDVSSTAEVQALHKQVIATHGRIDGAVNNAGISGQLGLATADYPEDLFDKVIAVNLKGVWLCMRDQINQMLTQGGGSIVNMASVAGLVAIPNAAYTASKHGVVGITKAAAINYGEQGIRVNAVCPGYVHTPATAPAIDSSEEVKAALIRKHAIGRLGEQEEIAEAVLWLLSDASSFVTGHAMPVDGGLMAK